MKSVIYEFYWSCERCVDLTLWKFFWDCLQLAHAAPMFTCVSEKLNQVHRAQWVVQGALVIEALPTKTHSQAASVCLEDFISQLFTFLSSWNLIRAGPQKICAFLFAVCINLDNRTVWNDNATYSYHHNIIALKVDSIFFNYCPKSHCGNIRVTGIDYFHFPAENYGHFAQRGSKVLVTAPFLKPL